MMIREFYQENVNRTVNSMCERLIKINVLLRDYGECNETNEFRFNSFKDLTPKYDLINIKFDHLKDYYDCHDWIKIDHIRKLVTVDFQKKDIPDELTAFLCKRKSESFSTVNNLRMVINFHVEYDIYDSSIFEMTNKLNKYINLYSHYNAKIYLDENDIQFLKNLIYNVRKAERYLKIDVKYDFLNDLCL